MNEIKPQAGIIGTVDPEPEIKGTADQKPKAKASPYLSALVSKVDSDAQEIPVAARAVEKKNVVSRVCSIKSDAASLCEVIRETGFTVRHDQLFFPPPNFDGVEICGDSLLKDKYRLYTGSLYVCLNLLEELQRGNSITDLGYEVGLCVIKMVGDDVTKYYKPCKYINLPDDCAFRSYLVFRNLDTNNELIFDPAICDVFLQAKPSPMTAKELKELTSLVLEKERDAVSEGNYDGTFYSYLGTFMPSHASVNINRYISKRPNAVSLQCATNLLFDAMYGKEMNPEEDAEEQSGKSLVEV